MTTQLADVSPEDPHLWLEEIEGEAALAQVAEWNARTAAIVTADPRFEDYQQRARAMFDDERRIAMPSMINGVIYNFWADKEHVRGLWRRSSEAAYLAGTPDWEVLIDIDALCRAEQANWVWKGADLLRPDGDRALVLLSDGGKDAVVVREFDLVERRFVEDGFQVDAAKTGATWLDRDTVLITTDFGEGSLTTSGYPREVRRWSRGTALADAPALDRVEQGDIRISPFVIRDAAGVWPTVIRARTIWSNEVVHVAPDGTLHAAPLPIHATLIGSVAGFAVAKLEQDGAEGKAGSLVAYSLADVVAGREVCLEHVMDPPRDGSIEGVSAGQSALFVNLTENVVGRIVRLDRQSDGRWVQTEIPAPENSTLLLGSSDKASDRMFFVSVGMTTPYTLYFYTPGETPRIVATAPARFDASQYAVEQHFAISADGTRVPFFVARPKNVSGPVPTLLYAYGGFRSSMLPSYIGPTGQFLLEAGCAYVIANIRGGGEFGPAWHAAALRENRQRAFDDFHAVAAHLKNNGIASKVAIQGGSNGGLLVAVAYTQRPELYDAVVCSVPLADMRRYHILLAGASWMGEYGNPDDPADWAFLSRYSPYHQLSREAHYPPVLFQTSTKDDRVHPGHARKMAARMAEMGHAFDYYENIDGGHGGSADNAQAAYVAALIATWLLGMLLA